MKSRTQNLGPLGAKVQLWKNNVDMYKHTNTWKKLPKTDVNRRCHAPNWKNNKYSPNDCKKYKRKIKIKYQQIFRDYREKDKRAGKYKNRGNTFGRPPGIVMKLSRKSTWDRISKMYQWTNVIANTYFEGNPPPTTHKSPSPRFFK